MNYTSGYLEVGLGNSSSGIMYAKMTWTKVCGKMCLKYLWTHSRAQSCMHSNIVNILKIHTQKLLPTITHAKLLGY